MYTCSCQCASCTARSGSSAPSTGDVESSTMASFLAEIGMLKRVSRGGCPHVVNLVAASSFADPVLMVMELAAYGSLLDYLRRSRQHVSMQSSYVGWDMHISAMHAGISNFSLHGASCLHLQFAQGEPYHNVLNLGEMLDIATQIAKGMVSEFSLATLYCLVRRTHDAYRLKSLPPPPPH